MTTQQQITDLIFEQLNEHRHLGVGMLIYGAGNGGLSAPSLKQWHRRYALLMGLLGLYFDFDLTKKEPAQ